MATTFVGLEEGRIALVMDKEIPNVSTFGCFCGRLIFSTIQNVPSSDLPALHLLRLPSPRQPLL